MAGGLFTKDGAGTLILKGDNTYTGGTRILDGTVVAEGGNAIGDTSSVFVLGGTFQVLNDETAATLSGNGGTVELGGANLTLSTSFANVTASYSGSITGSGGIVEAGGFSQVLSGNNSYLGPTQILAGTLYAVGASADSIPDASAVTVAAGATLSLVQPSPPFAGGESDDETIGSLAGAGNVDIGSQTLTVGSNDADTTFSGVIAGAGGSLIKTGAGTLILTGDATHGRGTVISDGTLQLGAGGTNGSLAGDLIDNAALSFDRSNTLTLSGQISGTGTVSQDGPGTTILGGDNSYTGDTNVNSGILRINGNQSLATGLTTVASDDRRRSVAGGRFFSRLRIRSG